MRKRSSCSIPSAKTWSFFSARATPHFTLTVRATGDGAGSVTSDPAGIDCGSDCDQPYVSGTAVTLRASPAPNAVFTGWNGCNTRTGSSCTVTMGSARFVTARFDLQRFDLTVITSGHGRGTVTSRPTGIDCGSDCSEPYAVDTTVTLTATARWGIVTWWDGCDTISGRGRRSRCTVTINTDRSVTVYFVRRPPTVPPTQGLPP